MATEEKQKIYELLLQVAMGRLDKAQELTEAIDALAKARAAEAVNLYHKVQNQS